MKFRFNVVIIIFVCLMSVVLFRGRAKAQEKPPLAEQVFKNVQVLRGMSVNEFMETMGFFAASLDANCTTCHGQDSGGSLGELCQRYAATETNRPPDDRDDEYDQPNLL